MLLTLLACRFNNNIQAETDFNQKKLSACELYPGLEKLPFPVQQLISVEIDKANTRAEYKPVPRWLGAPGEAPGPQHSCLCRFYRRYLVPCRHFFHKDKEVPFLDEARWQRLACHSWSNILFAYSLFFCRYAAMFEESGMAFYEKHISVIVEQREAPALHRFAFVWPFSLFCRW